MPKTVYSLSELAVITRLSKRRLHRLLVSGGVKLNRSGNRWMVAGGAIERAMPEFWDTLRRVENEAAAFAGEYST
jgi:hypothetical protein